MNRLIRHTLSRNHAYIMKDSRLKQQQKRTRNRSFPSVSQVLNQVEHIVTIALAIITLIELGSEVGCYPDVLTKT